MADPTTLDRYGFRLLDRRETFTPLIQTAVIIPPVRKETMAIISQFRFVTDPFIYRVIFRQPEKC